MKFKTMEELAEMSGSELVVYYNALVAEADPEICAKPVARFASSAKALQRINGLVSSIKGAASEDAVTSTVKPSGEPTVQEVETPTEGTTSEEEGATDMAKSAAKKAVKPKKDKAEGATRTKFSDDATIHLLVEENPRRGAAGERFKLYREGMKLGTYIGKFEGGRKEAMVHVRWDINKGHIKVTEPK